jgi:hypothetical protein
MNGGDTGDAELSAREKALVRICGFRSLYYVALAIIATFFLFNTASFLFGPIDQGAQVVVLINYVLIAVSVGVLVALILLCERQ